MYPLLFITEKNKTTRVLIEEHSLVYHFIDRSTYNLLFFVAHNPRYRQEHECVSYLFFYY